MWIEQLKKEKKKELSNLLMHVMKENEIDCFDCNNGQITYIKNSVKKPVNKKYLATILDQYFEGSNQEESEKLCKYILENRDTQVTENIKLKKKKI